MQCLSLTAASSWNACCRGDAQGHNYTDMVKLVDFAYDVPVSFLEGQGLVGGFTMRTINTTRLCATTVSPQCLKVKAADVSVAGWG